MATKKSKNLSFEASISRLEEIVRLMEQGGESLEDSLKLFEEGTALVTKCMELLDSAQLRVSIVTPGADGTPEEENFDVPD